MPTTIVVPVRESKRSVLCMEHLGVPAETLIFLRRLRRIELCDLARGHALVLAVEGSESIGARSRRITVIEDEMIKDAAVPSGAAEPGRRTEQHRQRRKTYLVYTHVVELGEGDARHPTKPLESASIDLAFLEPSAPKVDHEDANDDLGDSAAAKAASSCSPDVFCYLPVCCARLGFVVHAPFALVSSRQDLHRTSGWNGVLRREVARAFVGAMSELGLDPLEHLPEAKKHCHRPQPLPI